jgi:ATP-binding cassette subfamily C protein
MIQYFAGRQIKIVNQGFGAIKEVKILNKEKYVEKIFKQNIDEIEKNYFIVFFLNAMPRLFLEVISVIAVVVVSTISVFMYASTALMIPLMTLLAVSAVRLIPAFGAIATSLTTIRAKIPSFNFVSKEISELENTNIILNQENEKKIKFFKDIYVKKVNFRYPNTNAYSIIDFNLSINSGKKIGFIGSSGAGKSTFVNLLLGLLQPTDGKILIDGKDISENLRNWQSQIGYVSQDIYLLDDTIRNNIAFGQSSTSINSEYLLSAIKTAQLENFVNSLPNGEETIIGNRGVKISGGQKQRIGIARALYNKPRLLIFDEATSSLDLENERKIMDKICQSNKELTFIIISHRNNTVKNCDLIYVFDNGKLTDKGSYEEILSKHNHLQEKITN